jgi:hypothetical protein
MNASFIHCTFLMLSLLLLNPLHGLAETSSPGQAMPSSQEVPLSAESSSPMRADPTQPASPDIRLSIQARTFESQSENESWIGSEISAPLTIDAGDLGALTLRPRALIRPEARWLNPVFHYTLELLSPDTKTSMLPEDSTLTLSTRWIPSTYESPHPESDREASLGLTTPLGSHFGLGVFSVSGGGEWSSNLGAGLWGGFEISDLPRSRAWIIEISSAQSLRSALLWEPVERLRVQATAEWTSPGTELENRIASLALIWDF